MLRLRIRGLVIEFLVRRLDEEKLSRTERPQRTPSKSTVRIIALRVGWAIGRRLRTLAGRRSRLARGSRLQRRWLQNRWLQHAQKRFALHVMRDRNSHRLQEGGQDIDQPGAALDSFSGGAPSRQLEQERHANGLIVEKNPVRGLSVFAQGLAMISHDGYQRAVIKPAQPQPTEEFAHRGIGVCNFAVVRRGSVLGLVRLRRIIGVVRVVEMHPDEERPLVVCGQPLQRVSDDFAAAAFNRLVTVFSLAPSVEAGIVEVKSALKTGSRPCSWAEDQRADKRRGVISVTSKDVRSVGQILRERHTEIIHLVELRIRACEDGGM